jgi:hypothetical protein
MAIPRTQQRRRDRDGSRPDADESGIHALPPSLI